MQLSLLLNNILSLPKELDRTIDYLSLDSRSLGANSLFFALKGHDTSGLNYIQDAIVHGATAIVIETNDLQPSYYLDQHVVFISVPKLREQVGFIAAKFYGQPAQHFPVIGVTGTSGKTSCTHFIAQLFTLLGHPCGLIGSLGIGFIDDLQPSGLTTPDAIRIQASLAQLKAAGAQVLAIEVSSHSIDQSRIQGLSFAAGVFTNLSHDHLDYHATMEAYAAVKYRFFKEFPLAMRIINADDAYGFQWIHALKADVPVIAYSLDETTARLCGVPCIYADSISSSPQGLSAQLISPWGSAQIDPPILGLFNLSNLLAAIAVVCCNGFSFAQVVAVLAQLNSVPGRMQLIGGQQQVPLVVVDYAHKPDALDKVLQVLRKRTTGKLACVFGCGGERDISKRAEMARIAEQWADQVIVTNDNPRGEDPHNIAAMIMRGFSHPEQVWLCLDRSKAIENSIEWARPQDCVLIAGKGAETYQIIGDQQKFFDDVKQAKLFLKRKYGEGAC